MSFASAAARSTPRVAHTTLAALCAALACLSPRAFAQAQPTVQVYGVMDIAFGTFKDAGGARTTQVAPGNLTTSYIGFKGAEDLGSGLQATFNLESYLRNDSGDLGRYSGDAFWSRAANVGLSSRDWGTAKMGRIGTPLFAQVLRFNPLAASFGFSPAIRTHFSYTGKVAGDTAWNNAVSYTSPEVAGFTADLLYSARESASGANTSAALRYVDKAFAIGIVTQTVKVPFKSGEERSTDIGASYDFGVAKLFGQYGRVKESATQLATAQTRDTLSQLGVSVPVGPGAVLASWGQARTSAATASASATRTFTTVGYDWRLSKRTDLYAMWMSDQWRRREAGSSMAVGIRHAF